MATRYPIIDTSILTPTATGRSLVTATDAAAGQSALGLGSLATASSVNLATQVSGTLGVANGGTGGATAAAARTALGVVGSTTYYADSFTAQAGSESASITGTGSSATATLTASATSRTYSSSGMTAARVILALPTGVEAVEIVMTVTAASGVSTGGYRWLAMALRDSATGSNPTSLWGASWSDSGTSQSGSIITAPNAGTAAGNPSVLIAANRIMRLSLSPRFPLLGCAWSTTNPGVTWVPGFAPAAVSTSTASIPDVDSTTALAIWLQSFGSTGTSSVTFNITTRVVTR